MAAIESQTVHVQSAMWSKINWTAVITALLGLLTAFGVPISDELKVQLMVLITTVGPAAIVMFKTFFTTTVTPASAAKLTDSGAVKK